VTSEVLTGAERSIASFSAAADEATKSRIFAAVHFRNDLTSGHQLGRDVADFVLDHPDAPSPTGRRRCQPFDHHRLGRRGHAERSRPPRVK